MLKMEYFNFRLLLGVLRSKQVSGRRRHHSVYSVSVRGSFKLSIGERTVLQFFSPKSSDAVII